jgi:nifR3 family TIM-barrel protein
MAGITNTAFRRVCREAMTDALEPGQRGGLFVSEMITSRALVEGNEKTLRLIRFAADERPRSIQLYGVDPSIVGAAVRMIVEQDLADHIDLNFGCPVPKVTRKGGGAALPWRIGLFTDIVTAAVRAADAVPVTVKMRIGIDDAHRTYREAGLRAQEAGVRQVALHARTAAQFYGGVADWDAIADLTELLDVPVLGNGDIWEADDAVRMVHDTGCAGVVVGRGCLGRPWLFADLAHAFAGRPDRTRPGLATVASTMRRHAQLLVDWLGGETPHETASRFRGDPKGGETPHETASRFRGDPKGGETPHETASRFRGDPKGGDRGVVEFRKHVAWYLKGFAVGTDLRRALASSSTLAELDDQLARLDLDQPFPTAVLGQPRGRTSGLRSVVLPTGWLTSTESRSVPSGAELPDSGG